MNPMMSRRMFLGAVAAVTAETVVIAATPKEIATFGATPQMPIEVNHPYIPSTIPDLRTGELVFNAKGEVLGIIKCAEVEVVRDMIDVSTYRDHGAARHIAGPRNISVRYTVIGYGEAQVNVGISSITKGKGFAP